MFPAVGSSGIIFTLRDGSSSTKEKHRKHPGPVFAPPTPIAPCSRHPELMHLCCVLQREGLTRCKHRTDVFLLLSPRQTGFSKEGRNFEDGKDTEIQGWLCQLRVTGCCSMNVSVLAQPTSAQSGPRRGIYQAAHFWMTHMMVMGWSWGTQMVRAHCHSGGDFGKGCTIPTLKVSEGLRGLTSLVLNQLKGMFCQ